MKRYSARRQFGPQPSVPEPRRRLLEAVLEFARTARSVPSVLRIALLGSLATDKPVPHDAAEKGDSFYFSIASLNPRVGFCVEK